MAIAIHATVCRHVSLDLHGAFRRAEHTRHHTRDPRAGVHVRRTVLECARGALREHGSTDVAEGRNVHGAVLWDLEVRKDRLLPRLHAGTPRHGLRNITLRTVRVDGHSRPMVTGRNSIPVDVNHGVVKAIRERDGGDVERIAV